MSTELFSNLEKENLTLKEEKLKLEEQLMLLQKSAETHADGTRRLHAKVETLQARLRTFPGGDQDVDDEDDGDTLDTDLESKSR